jgi:hypothetical protein
MDDANPYQSPRSQLSKPPSRPEKRGDGCAIAGALLWLIFVFLILPTGLNMTPVSQAAFTAVSIAAVVLSVRGAVGWWKLVSVLIAIALAYMMFRVWTY